MKVFSIHEDNHGFIGVATTPTAAAYWLIQSNWVYSMSDIFNEEDGIGKPIKDVAPEEYMGDWENWFIDQVINDYEEFLPLLGFQLVEEELIGELSDLSEHGKFG